MLRLRRMAVGPVSGTMLPPARPTRTEPSVLPFSLPNHYGRIPMNVGEREPRAFEGLLPRGFCAWSFDIEPFDLSGEVGLRPTKGDPPLTLLISRQAFLQCAFGGPLYIGVESRAHRRESAPKRSQVTRSPDLARNEIREIGSRQVRRLVGNERGQWPSSFGIFGGDRPVLLQAAENIA